EVVHQPQDHNSDGADSQRGERLEIAGGKEVESRECGVGEDDAHDAEHRQENGGSSPEGNRFAVGLTMAVGSVDKAALASDVPDNRSGDQAEQARAKPRYQINQEVVLKHSEGAFVVMSRTARRLLH